MIASKQRGFTLVELSVGLVILGLVLVLSWRFGHGAAQRIREVEAPQALLAADQALLAFAAANSRLPCPDRDGSGVESCGAGAGTGGLPWVTLGLARADVRPLRYGVFRGAGLGVDLSGPHATDSYFPLLAMVPAAAGVGPSAFATPLGQANGMDLCDHLRRGAALPTAAATNTDTLRIVAPLAAGAGAPAALRNVAYALSLAGSRSADASNPNARDNVFAAPGQAVGADYDDTVLVADFGQLFDRLSCAGVLSAAGHTHFNNASSAAIFDGAMLDYKVQLELKHDMAVYGVVSASTGLTTAVAGAATAAASVLTASAWAVATLGSASGMVGFAAAAVASNALAVAAHAANIAKAASALSTTEARLRQFSGDDASSLHLLEHAAALATGASAAAPTLPSVRINAIAADAAGLH